jgi:hypothetical protein
MRRQRSYHDKMINIIILWVVCRRPPLRLVGRVDGTVEEIYDCRRQKLFAADYVFYSE